MSKIEEVARALWEADKSNPSWAWMLIETAPEAVAAVAETRSLARAALLAIREPDEGMAEAGMAGMADAQMTAREWLNVGPAAFAKGFSAAIDHALTQETSE